MDVLKVGDPTVGVLNFGTFFFELLIVELFGSEQVKELGSEQVEELALEEDESVDTSLDKQIAESVVS